MTPTPVFREFPRSIPLPLPKNDRLGRYWAPPPDRGSMRTKITGNRLPGFSCLVFTVLLACAARAVTPETPQAKPPKTIAVLDPADLQSQTRNREWGGILRDLFAESP